ncbi:MAG: choice-of-anchor E domain-containing protein [Planctomycetota bacterium]
MSFSDSVPVQTTDWTNSVTLSKFDPALGILTGLRIDLGGHIEGSIFFESQDPQPQTVTTNLQATIELSRPDASLIVSASPQVSHVDAVGAFDGLVDFGGDSGKTYSNQSQDVTVSHSSPPPRSDLPLFTGSSGAPGTIVLGVRAVGHSAATGSGNITQGFQTFASAVVTVTYFFAPDCQPNGVPDDQDISSGSSQDCDSNGVPDECQRDCNGDGTPDICEADCNLNGVPDECEALGDCDDDGTPDVCEADCDDDGTPDECDPTPCPDCVELNRQTPGSLLIYPEFDNRPGRMTLVTITNTDCDQSQRGINPGVDVEFVYIGKYGRDGEDLYCAEFNRTRHLTPCDTFTAITTFDNPQQSRGYLYVFAKNAQGQPIVYNHLIGSELLLGGDSMLDDALNALVFRGIGAVAGAGNGTLTDIDNDGIRDLDGREYDPAPAELLIPRFIGVDPAQMDPTVGNHAQFRSRLILIGLSGGADFTTLVDFLVYNDNEEVFSAQHIFRCWDTPDLTQISNAFLNSFLRDATNDAPGEIFGANREAGWFRVNGRSAVSDAPVVIADPAVYAVLVERLSPYSVAELPFELCTQDNGDLLPTGSFGDQ